MFTIYSEHYLVSSGIATNRALVASQEYSPADFICGGMID